MAIRTLHEWLPRLAKLLLLRSERVNEVHKGTGFIRVNNMNVPTTPKIRIVNCVDDNLMREAISYNLLGK